MRKIKITVSVFLVAGISLLWLGFQNQNSSQQEIDRINQQIILLGLDWKAGKTSLANLPSEERRLRLGAYRPVYADPNKFITIPEEPALPIQINWQDKNNKNFMTSVKDQGNCGSCWAFAACGAVEARYNIENDLFAPAFFSFQGNVSSLSQIFEIEDPLNIGESSVLNFPDLSEQDLISCSNAGDCDGGYAYQSFDYMETYGIVTEDCFPYQASNIPCQPCSNWNEKLFKIDQWGWVTGSTVNKYAVKNSLQSGPLVFFMEIYDDFYYYTSGIYEKTIGASYEGAHLVVLVGYNEIQDYWICKNSWGTNWGENGYFKIKFGECEGGTWVLKAWGIISSNSPPVINAVSDKIVKEGQELSFTVTATDPDGDTLTFSSPNLPSGATLNPSTGHFSWTPSHTQSGEYDVELTVTDGLLGSSTSVHITVVNVKKGIGRF
ncbi:MAG: hypothetical protein GF421_10985 [Candidatus Aminicenantes bacterium]|nr:hypothetical protein [Candidatus Aminicenantes bacterium]